MEQHTNIQTYINMLHYIIKKKKREKKLKKSFKQKKEA